MTNYMKEAALSYAQRGWAVFPLYNPTFPGCSCAKGDKCSSVGKHPRTQNGVKDATIDPKIIDAWWTRWPDASIGIATGAVSGLLVIDLDSNEGISGAANYAALADQHGSIDATRTLIVRTGRGSHLYYQSPTEPLGNSAGSLAPGVDIRADGGYVVAAPSFHANGRRYEVAEPTRPIAALPEWLLRMLRRGKVATSVQPEQAEVNTETEEMTVSTATGLVLEGSRNDSLYRMACALRGQQGMSEEMILTSVGVFNKCRCVPPLGREELRQLVRSACEHPPEVAKGKSLKRMEQSPLYWFEFNTREWFANQLIPLMDAEQIGWYICLKAHAWTNGGVLLADMDRLWKLAKAKTKNTFEKKCGLVLEEYDHYEEDGVFKLQHRQLSAQYADALEKWMTKRNAGAAGVEARKVLKTQQGAIETLSKAAYVQ